MLKREWLNAGSFTRAVSAATSVFLLVSVAVRVFTGRGAVVVTALALLSLVSLAVEGLVLWRRRRGSNPPNDGRRGAR